MNKVTGEVPAGFQLTKKSKQAPSISTPPELTVKPREHEMMQREILSKVNVRVMSFGIMFPGLEVVLRTSTPRLRAPGSSPAGEGPASTRVGSPRYC